MGTFLFSRVVGGGGYFGSGLQAVTKVLVSCRK